MKKLRMILLLFCFVCCLVSCGKTATEQTVVYDFQDALTQNEENTLKEQAQELMDYSGMNIIIVITNFNDDADHALLKAGYDEKDPVIAFVVYYGNSYSESEVCTRHNFGVISNDEIDKIGDLIYREVHYNNIYSASIKYLNAIEDYCNSKGTDYLYVVLIGLSISVAMFAIFSLIIHTRYHKKVHSSIYPFDKYVNLKLYVNRDSFINKTVTRVRISSNNNSSGGGGGFSGGHSSGRR